jgi:hypothetical protein
MHDIHTNALVLHQAGQLTSVARLNHQTLAREQANGALTGLGHFDEGLLHFRPSVEMDPKSPIGRTNFGKMLTDRSQAEEAPPLCQKIIRLQPDLATSSSPCQWRGNRTRKLGSSHSKCPSSGGMSRSQYMAAGVAVQALRPCRNLFGIGY